MEKRPAGKRLIEYNSLLKDMDETYREAVRACGLPDSAFWILYTLRADSETGYELTQSHICNVMSQPKQTTNSALKKLEAEGILELIPGSDRRTKYVRLTEKGAELASRTADRVIRAEGEAFSRMPLGEWENMLRLMRKFNSMLKGSLKGEDRK